MQIYFVSHNISRTWQIYLSAMHPEKNPVGHRKLIQFTFTDGIIVFCYHYEKAIFAYNLANSLLPVSVSSIFFFYNHYILVTKSKLYTSLLKASSWLWLFQMITETGTWSKSVDFRILQSLSLVWLLLHPSYDGVIRNFCDKWAYCWIRIFVVAGMGDSTIRLVG